MKSILFKLFLFWGIFIFTQPVFTQNLLTDGNFSTTTVITALGASPVPLNTWCSWKDESTVSNFSAAVSSGVCHYSFTNSTANTNNAWQVQLSQYGFALKYAYRYRLSFDVMADAERDFGVYLGEEAGAWTDLLGWSAYWQHATAAWNTRSIEFVAVDTFPLYKLSFEMGNVNTPIHFDNILLEELGPVTSTRVVVPGSFQSEVGCPGDWQPDCANTELTYKAGTVFWEGTFHIPAGNYEYKVALNSTWDINYGLNGVQNGPNIQLILPVTKDVTFIYDSSTHIITHSFSNQVLSVNLPGSFQSEAGCAGDWDPTCPVTNLTFDNSITGEWYGLYYIPAGNYEFKVAINNKWDENYGLNGILNGPNIPLNLSNFSRVAFRYNPTTHLTTTSIINDNITLAGSFQSELGCSGDWMPDCYFSSLTYNPVVNVWERAFILPMGNYQFKVAVNNSWTENYGLDGLLNGPNYSLAISSVSRVNFTYSPVTHIVTFNVVPITVVLPGDFQSELGCPGDWQPDCDLTRLTYDPVQKLFIDTFSIGKGHWEFKVALNNSWAENYGLYGERNGANIPLDVCFPSKVVFRYNEETHTVWVQFITNGICVSKFYDANVNGFQDDGEQPMEGISFTLTGNGSTQVQTTGSDGKAAFVDLVNGMYTVKETVPSGYLSSVQDSQTVDVYDGMASVNFGNVCLGAGGAKGMGYWMNKQSEAALSNAGLMQNALWGLRNLNLRSADGSDFDPYTYSEFSDWLKGANAKNMTYMASAQLAAMYLNQLMGYVSSGSIVYAPGCGFLNGKFMYTIDLIWITNYYLMFTPTATGNDANRANLECLKNALNNANNNLTFVQTQLCGTITAPAAQRSMGELNSVITTTAKVWPNPASTYFTLRPANDIMNENVQIRVMDVTGKLVYSANGSANKDYHFGEQFKAGLYFVEIIQGTSRTTVKLIKQ